MAHQLSNTTSTPSRKALATIPLKRITMTNQIDLVVLAVAVVVSVKVALATRKNRPVTQSAPDAAEDADVTAAVHDTLAAYGADSWAAVYVTTDGEQFGLWPHDQPARRTAQLLADAAHELTCPGCDRCHLSTVV